MGRALASKWPVREVFWNEQETVGRGEDGESLIITKGEIN